MVPNYPKKREGEDSLGQCKAGEESLKLHVEEICLECDVRCKGAEELSSDQNEEANLTVARDDGIDKRSVRVGFPERCCLLDKAPTS